MVNCNSIKYTGFVHRNFKSNPKRKAKLMKSGMDVRFLNWFNIEISKIRKEAGPARYKLLSAVKRNFKNRVKEGYTGDDFKTALKNIENDKQHIENGYMYVTPEYFTRAVILEKYANMVDSSESSNQPEFKIKAWGA